MPRPQSGPTSLSTPSVYLSCPAQWDLLPRATSSQKKPRAHSHHQEAYIFSVLAKMGKWIPLFEKFLYIKN